MKECPSNTAVGITGYDACLQTAPGPPTAPAGLIMQSFSSMNRG